MSTRNSSAVPYFRVPVPYFRVPQNGTICYPTCKYDVQIQCTGIYILIDTYRVPEVPYFLDDRELVRENSKIKGIIFVFSTFSKLLSIAEKVGYFGYRSLFLAQEACHG